MSRHRREVADREQRRIAIVAAAQIREHAVRGVVADQPLEAPRRAQRSEEHTSELQSLMRISYAVFCLKKKTKDSKHAYNASETAAHTNCVTQLDETTAEQ